MKINVKKQVERKWLFLVKSKIYMSLLLSLLLFPFSYSQEVSFRSTNQGFNGDVLMAHSIINCFGEATLLYAGRVYVSSVTYQGKRYTAVDLGIPSLDKYVLGISSIEVRYIYGAEDIKNSVLTYVLDKQLVGCYGQTDHITSNKRMVGNIDAIGAFFKNPKIGMDGTLIDILKNHLKKKSFDKSISQANRSSSPKSKYTHLKNALENATTNEEREEVYRKMENIKDEISKDKKSKTSNPKDEKDDKEMDWAIREKLRISKIKDDVQDALYHRDYVKAYNIMKNNKGIFTREEIKSAKSGAKIQYAGEAIQSIPKGDIIFLSVDYTLLKENRKFGIRYGSSFIDLDEASKGTDLYLGWNILGRFGLENGKFYPDLNHYEIGLGISLIKHNLAVFNGFHFSVVYFSSKFEEYPIEIYGGFNNQEPIVYVEKNNIKGSNFGADFDLIMFKFITVGVSWIPDISLKSKKHEYGTYDGVVSDTYPFEGKKSFSDLGLLSNFYFRVGLTFSLYN